MKNIKFLISLGVTVLFISCSNMKNKGNSDGNTPSEPKKYTSAAEAANAAKNDMLAGMDQNVNFGVDKEKLRASKPEEAIQRNQIDMNGLINADSSTSFEKIAMNEGSSVIPFVNNREIIAVCGLSNDNNEYRITGLGDKYLTSELNMIYAMNAEMRGKIAIMEIQNLTATIYELKGPNGNMYYSSYNGHNIKEGISESEMIRILRADAITFNKNLGDKIKKQKLVK